MLLSRFSTRFIYQYGISGCKLQMRTGSQTGLQCQEAEFLAHSQNLKVMNMLQTLLLWYPHLFLYLFLAPLGRNQILKSDYLNWKWHPNKIYTRSLCYGCRSSLLRKQNCYLRAQIFSCNFSEKLSRENKMNLL